MHGHLPAFLADSKVLTMSATWYAIFQEIIISGV